MNTRPRPCDHCPEPAQFRVAFDFDRAPDEFASVLYLCADRMVEYVAERGAAVNSVVRLDLAGSPRVGMGTRCACGHLVDDHTWGPCKWIDGRNNVLSARNRFRSISASAVYGTMVTT